MNNIFFKNFTPPSFFRAAPANGTGKTERTGSAQAGGANFGHYEKARRPVFTSAFDPARLAGKFGRFGKQQSAAEALLKQAASEMAKTLATFAEQQMSPAKINKLASAIRKQMTPEQREMLDSALKLATQLGSKAGVESLKMSMYMELLATGKMGKEACMQGLQKIHDKLAGMQGKQELVALGEQCLNLMKRLPQGSDVRRMALEIYDNAIALGSKEMLSRLSELLNAPSGAKPEGKPQSKPQGDSAQGPQAGPQPQAGPRPQPEPTQGPKPGPQTSTPPGAGAAPAPEMHTPPAASSTNAIRITDAMASKATTAEMGKVVDQLRQNGFDAARLRELQKDIRDLRSTGDTEANVESFKQKYQDVMHFDKNADITAIGFTKLMAAINVNLKKNGE